MNDIQKENLLRKIENGKAYDEGWLIRHTDTNCSVQDLNDMVKLGLLLKIDKDPNDFMSDNQYMITEAGLRFIQK